MGAWCTGVVIALAVALVFASIQVIQRTHRREGLAPSAEGADGPSPIKLARINANNIKYLQDHVSKLQTIHNYIQDLSGQEHYNQQTLTQVAQQAQQRTYDAIGGNPGSKEDLEKKYPRDYSTSVGT